MQDRSRYLYANIAASFLIKGWSAVVVLLQVPATLHCLGDYQNGIWLTISSLLLWIDNMDIGLGNGLRNKVAEYMAHGETERTRRLVASTFGLLTCIVIPVLLVLLLLIAVCDPYGVLNAEPSQVDHLEQILMVREKKGRVRSIDISAGLNVTKASVSIAMRKLRENDYIHMGSDNLISLTEKGYAIARKIYDRHQALTKYLMQLGVPEP